MPLLHDRSPKPCAPRRALLAALACLAAAACGEPVISEAVLREAMDRGTAEVVRDRDWVASSLEAAYSRAGTHLWIEDADLSERGRELLGALEHAAEEGLDPEDYGVTATLAALGAMQAFPESDSARRVRALADLEVRLSIGLLSYARDLVIGRFDPDEAGQDWRIEPELLPASPLARVRDGESVADILSSLRPRAPVYPRLVRALATLRDVERGGGWPEVDANPRPRIGWAARGIATLRARLATSEDSLERLLAASGGDSDVYDADLAGALRRFQSRHGLEPDGAPGAATLRALNAPVGERIEAILLNLDRVRWLPRDLGSRAIVVNVAGFELQLLTDHRADITMDVIVGSEGWATKVFAARLERLEFNPYWNVPASIAAAEIFPAAREDPGYLARNGFEVSGTGPGLRVRQRPGARNALGRVKFLFPNPYSIYLHDTPDGHLFERANRAFSHGCIRLERPLELARDVVEHDTDLPPPDVDLILASGRTVAVELERPLDVYVVYLTAWVDEDGTIRYYRDIYDRDEALGVLVASS